MSLDHFWHLDEKQILDELKSSPEGLSHHEASVSLKKFGKNRLNSKKKETLISLLLAQFNSPLILLLFIAALLSFFLGQRTDALIISAILILSGLLGFYQEKKAVGAVKKLLSVVKIKSTVLREGKSEEILLEQIVPGDILILNAGDIIPADARLLEARDFFVDEAALTGEALAQEKSVAALPENTPLSRRTNSLFMGTHAISGTAKAVVVFTGKATEFGKISAKLEKKAPQTSFEKGIKEFGYFLLIVTLLLISAIFVINLFFHRPIISSLLFSLALAVGLTPQLLPAIISVNLAHGASKMAEKKVIVKKLAAIENFGSMTMLCVDKTGTVTEGKMELQQAVTVDGKQNEKVLLFASLNASMQSGYTNPLDEAVLHKSKTDHSSWKKLDELPYDFCRKRITILAQKKGEDPLLISKGAFVQMMGICSKIELEDGTLSPLASHQKELEEKFQEYSKKGSRVLAVAYLPTPAKTTLKRGEEKEMIFLGFLLFVDPIKKGVGTTIAKLKEAGIDLKLITGDNRFVAEHVSREIGLLEKEVVLGDEIAQLDEQALAKKVSEYKVFAEVEPNQKERLLLSLKKSGVVTGYLGDGINDVTALHIADVGISVNSSVDVVKEEADIVLLKKDLSALLTGVEEGRRTFANTMKYIFMATSANFGNMFSMAGASLTLSFLPLLPKQILLINFLTDFPEIAIATDKVDEEMVKKPLRWDIKFIRKFMITFGLISSFFDFSTYLVLIFLLRSNMEQFRTGWFIESVVSAALIVLAVRTRRPFFTSMPSIYLLTGVVLVIALACLAPLTPLAPLFNFVPLPSLFYLVVSGIVLAYFLSVELAKLLFYRKNPC